MMNMFALAKSSGQGEPSFSVLRSQNYLETLKRGKVKLKREFYYNLYVTNT